MAFSDLHADRAKATALVAASRDVDLVIGAGDFCNMRAGLSDALAPLGGIVPPFVLVPGNAESDAELRDAARPEWSVLHGSGIELAGCSLFGLGYAVPETPFGDWSCDLDEATAAALLAPLTSVDVLITHAPPKGVADRSSAGEAMGSTAVWDAIDRAQPSLALCGHIHHSWGVEGQIGDTRVVNLGPDPRILEL
ncbi:MAG: metallophosphoesterase family protein [Pseudomonadota bacterium]